MSAATAGSGASADAIVVGGGHNGLVCAALLAGSGRRTVLLEASPVLGGLAAPETFHPGFTAPGLLHDTCFLRPWIADGLSLERHGLRFVGREPALLAAEPGGRGLLFAPGSEIAPAEIASASRVEAEAWVEWRAELSGLQRGLLPLLDDPLPELPPSGLPGWWELLRKALSLRRLGRERMAELLRLLPMPAADVLEERFDSPLLQGAFCALALQGGFLGPRSPGGGALLVLSEVARYRSVHGGPAAVVAALVAAASEAGAELRTSAVVRRIEVSGGKVTGVLLEDGEVIAAPVVVSTADPTRTLLGLIAPTRLPPPLGERGRTWRTRGTTAVVRLAIEGALEFTGREGQAIERALVAGGPREVERAFRAAKHGELPEHPCLDLAVPSIGEARLAPSGRNVVSILAHWVPYDLHGGWTDEARARLLDLVLARLASVAPGLPGQVLASQVLAPPDLQARHRLTGGQIHHGEPALDQLLFLRPAPECARAATPLPGLYLGGSGSHPGGGITGVPGALAARAVVEG